jgi:hypothetical protein
VIKTKQCALKKVVVCLLLLFSFSEVNTYHSFSLKDIQIRNSPYLLTSLSEKKPSNSAEKYSNASVFDRRKRNCASTKSPKGI